MPGLHAPVAVSAPTSSHENRNPWEFSVPLEYQDAKAIPRQGPAPSRYTNGVDQKGYLDTPGVYRPDSTSISTRDGDSLLDLYNGRASVNGNGINDVVVDDSKWIDSEKLARLEGDQLEYAKWIDRDRLQRIERDELEQAGIRLPLKNSRASLQNLQKQYYHDELKRQRADSGSSEEEGQNYYTPYERVEEPRYSALQSSDTPSQPMRNTTRVVSGSKIPVPSQSRIPIRQSNKAASARQQQSSPEQGSDEDSTYQPSHMRKRSYSAGSAVLLNSEGESATSTVAKPLAPKTSRTQSHNAAKPTGVEKKKQSRTSANLAKNKHKSNPQLAANHRPTTAVSSNNRDAPEGPPPWSSTFSPDPKLPPDQQLIPTVAKRLQQEQWEKEGAFATVYDGKLRPLKVEDFTDRPRPPTEPENKEEHEDVEVNTQDTRVEPNVEPSKEKQQEDDNEWPLRSPTLPPASSLVPSPKVEDIAKPEQVGDNATEKPPYEPRTITKVNGRTMGDTSPVSEVNRAPHEDEEALDGKKKKKFLCCIVM